VQDCPGVAWCVVFERLQLTCTGDFNLAFLDLIDEVDGLKWSGNCNELNAAYSADGRIYGDEIDKQAIRALQAPSDVLSRPSGIAPRMTL
jgi:hypothetical protein